MRQTPERTERRIAEFWSLVAKSEPNECWEWQGCRVLGYGKFSFYGKSFKAHRLAYQLTFGDPGELHVCHKCDNPPCCNPAHLFLGTHQDNMQDAKEKGRCATKDNGRWPEREILKGEQIGNHKITESIVLDIRSLYACKAFDMRGLSEKFGLSMGAIFKIVRGKMWAHVGGPIAKPQRLSEDQIQEVLRLHEQGHTLKQIGDIFGFSAAAICATIKRRKHS